LPNRVAVKAARAVIKLPVPVKTPEVGLYTSELLSMALVLKPPVTSTSPLDTSVAAFWVRAKAIGPVGAKVPDAGLYYSALARTPSPPAMRIWPFGSKVAV
jgi:hypothetical protein